MSSVSYASAKRGAKHDQTRKLSITDNMRPKDSIHKVIHTASLGWCIQCSQQIAARLQVQVEIKHHVEGPACSSQMTDMHTKRGPKAPKDEEVGASQ
eukprot:5434089-Amphidinium_carterae.1